MLCLPGNWNYVVPNILLTKYVSQSHTQRERRNSIIMKRWPKHFLPSCQPICHGHCCKTEIKLDKKKSFNIIKLALCQLLHYRIRCLYCVSYSINLLIHLFIVCYAVRHRNQTEKYLTAATTNRNEIWNIAHILFKILTQFQGRSRIPEGTSQRLSGCLTIQVETHKWAHDSKM